MQFSNFVKIFKDHRQLQIFILGIYSGMPLTIIYSTLSAWMKSDNIDLAIITSFAISRIAYSLKFLWAPFIDQINLPFSRKIGHRKSWMCLFFVLIASIIFSYSYYQPAESLNILYILTILLGLSSASLDIVIDAFRIDTIDPQEQSIAASNAVFGYLLGGLISGAGALYLAQDYGWSIGFSLIAILYLLGLIFVLTLTEPKVTRQDFQASTLASWKIMTIEPFKDFLKKEQALLILLMIIFYKMGDAFLGVVSYPFYLEMGFSFKEISSIVKVFGLGAMIFGSYIASFIMLRYGHFIGLIISGLAQSITNLAFIWLHRAGYNTGILTATIAVENIGVGMGNAALVGYLSYLCNRKFSATQYALLSSASGLFSHSLVAYGGTLQKMLGWDNYFIMTVLMGLPALSLLIYLNKKTKL